jgi:hypothetical protein
VVVSTGRAPGKADGDVVGIGRKGDRKKEKEEG